MKPNIKTKAARGQTICVPVGKDNSDYKGGASKEVSEKASMGGGMNNLSHTLGKGK